MAVQSKGALGAGMAAVVARLRMLRHANALRNHWGDALAITFLVAVSVGVYSLVLREPVSSDDCSYFEYASGKVISGLHHKQRVVVVASTMLAQALFGLTPTAYYAVSLFYSSALIVAIYLLTRTLAGVVPSLLAALLFLGHPTFLQNMTLLLPDIPALFWFVVGTAIALHVFLQDKHTPNWLPALAGLALFLSVAAKESMATLLPGMILMPLLLRNNPGRWRLFLVLAGAVVAFELLQTLSYWILKGDPLHRLHAVTGDHVKRMHNYAKDPSAMPQNIDWAHLVTRFFEMNERRLPARSVAFWGVGYWSWFSWSALAALGIAGVHRDRPVLTLGGLMLVAWATLTFSIVSLDPLIPMVRTKLRYFLVVTVFWPPLMMSAVARALARHTFKVPKWGVACAVAPLAAVTLWFTATFVVDYVEDSRHLVRNGRTEIRDVGKKVQKLIKSGTVVKRVVGRSRPTRSGRIYWTPRDYTIKPYSRRRTFTKFKRGDLLITKERFHGWTSNSIVWRRVGRGVGHYFYSFESWNEPLRSGSVRIYSSHSALLKKRGGSARQRLRIRLEVSAAGARPKALVFLTYRKKGRPKRKSLKWKRAGQRYIIDTTSPAFYARDVVGVALDLKVAGRGTLSLLRKDISQERG